MFLDDSACNLASLNLLAFDDASGAFDVEGFEHAVRLTFLAQEILVDEAHYPTERIGANSHGFRPLGLGYANLGALLMSRGLPYDSETGRAAAAAITAIVGGEAYAMSARMAAVRGAFEGYAENREPMLQVMGRHHAAAREIAPDADEAFEGLRTAAVAAWDRALQLGRRHGYRNAQATVLAPTGTIAFMMDCDTTGIEPDISLVKYKRLAGGGMLRIVNQTVGAALSRLGYDAAAVADIVGYIDDNDTIEGAPHLRDEHLPVFDCAFRSSGGTRAISPMGHVRMMSAVQPFLSGAISKTVNLPVDATVADIRDVYLSSWRLGLKAVAVYRDGCKASQPLSTGATAEAPDARGPARRRLPDERQSITHKFEVGGHSGYITVGMYEDGAPGEIFVVMAKQGSTVGGLMDALATSVSISLQHGVPLSVLARRFVGTRFEPSGFTRNHELPMAKSITDYIFRWLLLKFPEAGDEIAVPTLPAPTADELASRAGFVQQTDAPPCAECGSLMVPNGSCYKCLNCGGTSGCS